MAGAAKEVKSLTSLLTFFFLEIIKLCVGRETEKLTTMVHDNFIPCGFLLLLGISMYLLARLSYILLLV